MVEAMTNTTRIVQQHLRASRLVRESFKSSPRKAREFLIKAGIMNKKGTGLAKRYR
jgi:hypothetical protein